MRIMLADDEEKVRSALRLLVDEMANGGAGTLWADPCRIVEAASAQAVVRELGREAADVLLLDWELAGMPAGDLLDKVRELSPGCTVIAMSGRSEAMQDAADRGADEFVSKNDPPDRLVSALLQAIPV